MKKINVKLIQGCLNHRKMSLLSLREEYIKLRDLEGRSNNWNKTDEYKRIDNTINKITDELIAIVEEEEKLAYL